ILNRSFSFFLEEVQVTYVDLFTGRLKTEIPTILRTMCGAIMSANCHITELDLSDNAFGPVGAEGLIVYLQQADFQSAYSLQVLKLNNNGLGAGGKCHRNASRDGLEFKLKTFVAGRNRLEDPGAKALAEAFEVLRSLEEISIPQNGIRAEGICALASAFKSNPSLRIINVNDNTCTAKGAIALAEVGISILNELEILDIGDSLSRDDGILSICDAITEQHYKLQVTDSLEQLCVSAPVKSSFCFPYRTGKNMKVGMCDPLHSILCVYMRSSNSDVKETTDADDGDLNDLLNNLGCMKFTESGAKASDDDVVSFLNQQLKLDTILDAEPVARRIEEQTCMRVLDLRGNTLGIDSGARIAEAIKRHPELQKCLWSDMFTGRLKNEIPPILKSLCSAMISTNCHITELDLSDNAFGPIGAEGIQEFLVSPAAFSLEVLKLNNNGLGAGGKVVAKCLSKCFSRSKVAGRRLKLKTFIAGRNRLEVPGAVALAEAFTKIGTLEELALPQNGITSKGVEALATCFQSNPNLRIINLNDNTATQLGSAAIAKALPSLSKLEVLNLGDCLCRDQGCHAIVDALSPTIHKNLREVELSGAELTGPAAMQIAEKWKKLPASTRLIVASNNFGGMFVQLRGMVAHNVVVGFGSARLVLELALIIAQSDKNEEVVNATVSVAGTLHRLEDFSTIFSRWMSSKGACI
ncbi:unnamed protein product, partial [Heligmosomoides polygyrus]|uniref:Ran gtpase-activating protein n=1 Tax=Heligmosomoides polygyrus TaxID=6339 RepID=A0A183GLC4_HELPZ